MKRYRMDTFSRVIAVKELRLAAFAKDNLGGRWRNHNASGGRIHSRIVDFESILPTSFLLGIKSVFGHLPLAAQFTLVTSLPLPPSLPRASSIIWTKGRTGTL